MRMLLSTISDERLLTLPKITFDLRVSKSSLFKDDSWNFEDSTLERLNSVSPSKLRIDWFLFFGKIPVDILVALKVLAYAYLHCSQIIGKRNKPNTVCVMFQGFLQLFLCIYEASFVKISDDLSTTHIESIFDIDIKDIEKGAKQFKFSLITRYRPLLRACTKIEIVREINYVTGYKGKLKWSENAVDSLDILRIKSPAKSNYGSSSPMPDDLVVTLIVAASSDVSWFLQKLEIPISGEYAYVTKSSCEDSKIVNVKKAFYDYARVRHDYASDCIRVGKIRSGYSKSRRLFREEHGVLVNDFKIVVERIQSAARYLILQFTGARYSESISFRNDSVFEKSGDYFIRGTIIKGLNENLITNTDHWVAIPIVRDAVAVLKLINDYTLQENLFSSNEAVILSRKASVLSNFAINGQLNRYLYDIDNVREFSRVSQNRMSRDRYVKVEFSLSTHKIRTTLANQLFKCRASLKVIAYHFHHSYLAMKLYKIPNPVTAGYGKINNEILNSATSLERGKMELIESLYSPDAVLAGGGADKFIQNRNDFFSGEFAKGNSKKAILKQLLKRTLPFADVVLGYCGGKNKIVDETGKEKDPPCVGGMRCNPGKCANAIIPKSKVHHWQSYLENNLNMLNNPEFFYAKETLEKHIEEAREVLKILSNENS